MKLFEIALAEDDLRMSDAELGAKARRRLIGEMTIQKAALDAGRSAVRKKLGTPISIDGVDYDSRKQAMEALGMSFAAFSKKYPMVDVKRELLDPFSDVDTFDRPPHVS